MPAVLEHDEPGAKGCGDGLRRLERDRVLTTMDDERWYADLPEGGSDVEVTEARPDALLNAPDHPERRQVAGSGWIGEVPGHAQLERPLPVCIGITLAEVRRGELGAKLLHGLALLSPREFGLELLSKLARDRGGIEQCERRRNEVDSSHVAPRHLGGEQHGEQRAPRIANDVRGGEDELRRNGCQDRKSVV